MTISGITWLHSEQVEVIFNAMKADDVDGITIGDWLARFRFEPMKAAMEVQRALEREAQDGLTPRKSRSKVRVTRKLDMAFSAFQNKLSDLGVTWLSVEQQRLIFDTIDVDKSGTITEQELENL